MHVLPGYIGTDFFTYRIQLGGMNTSTANVAITIEPEPESEGDEEEGRRRAQRVSKTTPVVKATGGRKSGASHRRTPR